MTPTHWMLAGIALVVWVACYLHFFSANITRWFQQRPQRRAAALEAAERKAAERQRMLDELARKYPLPPSAAAKPASREG